MNKECEHITIDDVINGYTKHAQCCEETGCYTSASEFRQVVVWLRELKRLREQERPHGEWIDITGRNDIVCSVCRHKAQVGCIEYCGCCGADMRKEWKMKEGE